MSSVGGRVGVRVRGRVGLAALAVAVSMSALPDPGASAAATATTAPMAIPLVSGVTTSGLSSVALPMGDQSQPENTFWELFLQPAPGARWGLRTPPGVASNGGLAVATAPGQPLTVGFLPSQLLHFSPVAQSGDGGTHWSPGFLPAPLVAAPDALASVPTPRSANGSATATDAIVTIGSGQRVLTGQGVGGWRTLVTGAALARSVAGCRVTRITAVTSVRATTGTAEPALGVLCAQRGRLGVLVASTSVRSGGAASPSWTNVGPRLTGSLHGSATVLRLESSAAGLTGLADVATGSARALVALWRSSPSAAWALSAPLRVPAGWSVRATATGGSLGQGEATLLGNGADLRVDEIAGPASRWVALSAPPLGTEALVFSGGLTDAFSVSGSTLRVWTSSVGATVWQRTQVTTVPVPYGSSS